MRRGSRHAAESVAKNRASALSRPKGWAPSGPSHYRWQGGRRVDKRGYVMIYSPEHPSANAERYVMEHRLVMEKKIGRLLSPSEQVHHRNQIKDDNRPENLELVVHTEHLGRVSCPHCRKTFLIK